MPCGRCQYKGLCARKPIDLRVCESNAYEKTTLTLQCRQGLTYGCALSVPLVLFLSHRPASRPTWTCCAAPASPACSPTIPG